MTHDLAHFLFEEPSKGKCLKFDIYIRKELIERFERATFLAGITKEEDVWKYDEGKCYTVYFFNLKEIEKIVPIINEIMKEQDHGFPYFEVSDAVRNYFD